MRLHSDFQASSCYDMRLYLKSQLKRQKKKKIIQTKRTLFCDLVTVGAFIHMLTGIGSASAFTYCKQRCHEHGVQAFAKEYFSSFFSVYTLLDFWLLSGMGGGPCSLMEVVYRPKCVSPHEELTGSAAVMEPRGSAQLCLWAEASCTLVG